MSNLILKTGSNLLIVHRRMFEHDAARFFVGTVEAYDAGVVRLTGYSFAYDSVSDRVIRKEQPRTKIISLMTGMQFFYELPAEVDPAEVRFERGNDGRLLLVDVSGYQLDLTEMPPHRIGGGRAMGLRG